MENPRELFMANVARSLDTVLAVARSMVLRGHSVSIAGMRFAESYQSWQDAADSGDDITIGTDRVNVKQSSRSFGSVDEFAAMFPGRERPILVSAAHVAPPDYYMIVNRDRTGALLIPSSTKEHWGVRRGVRDARYGTSQDCFDVAPEHVLWMNLGI